MVPSLVGSLLLQSEFLAVGLPRRHENVHMRQGKRQKAPLLPQPTPAGKGYSVASAIRLSMDAASHRLTEKEDREGRIDQQDIFHRVVFFLAAITSGLLSRVLGADDASFGAVMGKSGELGAAATGASATATGASTSGVTTAAASAPVTPSRWARA
jgi:hypothetical protein